MGLSEGGGGQDLTRGQNSIVTGVSCMCSQFVTLSVWLCADRTDMSKWPVPYETQGRPDGKARADKGKKE